MTVDYGNFANSAPKLVSMATSLEQLENEGRIGHPQPFSYPIW